MEVSKAEVSSTDIVLLDPRHQGFLDGNSRRIHDPNIAIRVILGGYAAIFGPLGIVLLIAGAVALWTEAALEEHGVKVTATIIEQTTTVISTNKKGEQTLNYLIIYQFSDNRQIYTITEKVSPETYNRYHKGDSLAVRYLPENPKVSQVMGESNDDTRNFILMALVFVGSAAVVSGWCIYRWQSNQILGYEGKIIKGRIVDVQTKRAFRGGSYLNIHYRFLTPEGQEIRKSIASIRQDLFKNPPRYWAQVAILYLNDHHYQIL